MSAGATQAETPTMGVAKTGGAPLPEFALAAACCRWQPSEERNFAIRAATQYVHDWDCFLRIVKRHRVTGLAGEALRCAGVALLPQIAGELAALVGRNIRRSMKLAAETGRLQGLLAASGIPVIVLKGVALEQLAYGSFAAKQTRDIDLLVPPERAEAALLILENDGYTLSLPAKRLNKMQRRALIRYGREVELLDPLRRVRVELQWRVADNPLLLKSVDARAATQTVSLSERAVVRTLAPEDLFAYLCLRGARHSWSRLKWLADLNALVVSSGADIEHLCRHAQKVGAGICAGQALSLCQLLLGLKLPTTLADELQTNKRCRKLVAVALTALTAPHILSDRDPGIRGVARELRNQFLLGRGLRFYTGQCALAFAGTADIVRLPLPRPLHFIYPLVRVPLWLWRRIKLAFSPPRLHPG
jgi:hypothetical protein